MLAGEQGGGGANQSSPTRLATVGKLAARASTQPLAMVLR
jgi:hypothetical protein